MPRCASAIATNASQVQLLVAEVAEAVEQRGAAGLLAKADLQDPDLARRVGRALASREEVLGVLALDRGRGVAIELLLVDLAGGELGARVLDRARGEPGPELIARGVAPLLERRPVVARRRRRLARRLGLGLRRAPARG